MINTASFVGTRVPVPNAAIYGATKAAAVSLTSAIAADFGSKGLRCYALCPWITDTPMLDQMLGPMAGAKRMMAQLNPSGQRLCGGTQLTRKPRTPSSDPRRWRNGDRGPSRCT